MIIDIDGIGFKSVDKLALNMGIKEDDKRRVKAAILYTITNYCHSTGNTYLSLEDIYYNLNKLLKIDTDNFIEYIKKLMIDKLIIKDDKKFYHHTFYDA